VVALLSAVFYHCPAYKAFGTSDGDLHAVLWIGLRC
jgi:hypothetical protein